MWFKLTYSLAGMFIQTTVDGPKELAVTAGEGKEIRLFSKKTEKGVETLMCETVLEREVPTEIREMFDSLAKSILPRDDPPTVDLPFFLSLDAKIEPDGRIPAKWRIPLRIMPKHFQRISAEISRELSELASGFVKTVRWVQQTSGKQRPFARVDFQWSHDKSNWRYMPESYSISVLETKGVSAKEADAKQALIVWNSGEREPLPHELIREALDISHSNPRSALLIGLSALETGLKNYIQFLVPNCDVVLERMPSPPAFTMAQEVIPELHRRLAAPRDGLPLEKESADYLKKWVAQRNQVAHGSKKSVATEELEEFLKFVRRQLYMLDLWRGQDWAKKFAYPEDDDTFVIVAD